MDKLISDINRCFLALHAGDKDQFKKYDIVSLKNQLESNQKYLGREFLLLQNSFTDLFANNREKLTYYKTRISTLSLIDGQKPEHEILKDIYEWAGSDKEPYFEQYVAIIKLNEVDSQVENQDSDFRYYLKPEFAEKVCVFLSGKLKDAKPAEKAKWIFVLFKKGLFNPETVPDEKALYAQNSMLTYRIFYKTLQILVKTNADQEKAIKQQTKQIFDERKLKNLPPELDPDYKKYFDELNQIL